MGIKLDANGNPIQVKLDANGNPITKSVVEPVVIPEQLPRSLASGPRDIPTPAQIEDPIANKLLSPITPELMDVTAGVMHTPRPGGLMGSDVKIGPRKGPYWKGNALEQGWGMTKELGGLALGLVPGVPELIEGLKADAANRVSPKFMERPLGGMFPSPNTFVNTLEGAATFPLKMAKGWYESQFDPDRLQIQTDDAGNVSGIGGSSFEEAPIAGLMNMATPVLLGQLGLHGVSPFPRGAKKIWEKNQLPTKPAYDMPTLRMQVDSLQKGWKDPRFNQAVQQQLPFAPSTEPQQLRLPLEDAPQPKNEFTVPQPETGQLRLFDVEHQLPLPLEDAPIKLDANGQIKLPFDGDRVAEKPTPTLPSAETAPAPKEPSIPFYDSTGQGNLFGNYDPAKVGANGEKVLVPDPTQLSLLPEGYLEGKKTPETPIHPVSKMMEEFIEKFFPDLKGTVNLDLDRSNYPTANQTLNEVNLPSGFEHLPPQVQGFVLTHELQHLQHVVDRWKSANLPAVLASDLATRAKQLDIVNQVNRDYNRIKKHQKKPQEIEADAAAVQIGYNTPAPADQPYMLGWNEIIGDVTRKEQANRSMRFDKGQKSPITSYVEQMMDFSKKYAKETRRQETLANTPDTSYQPSLEFGGNRRTPPSAPKLPAPIARFKAPNSRRLLPEEAKNPVIRRVEEMVDPEMERLDESLGEPLRRMIENISKGPGGTIEGLGKSIADDLRKKSSDLPMFRKLVEGIENSSEKGMSVPKLLLPMGGAAIGGAYGGTQGKDVKERVANAIMGSVMGGIGGFAGTYALQRGGGMKKASVDSLPQSAVDRIRPNDPPITLRNWLKQGIDDFVHGVVGETLNPEHNLKRNNQLAINRGYNPKGFRPAIDALTEFKSKRLDVASNSFKSLKYVLSGLKSAAEYKDFQALVAFRHDLASVKAGKGSESGMSANQLQTYIDYISQNTDPRVLEAVRKHSEIVDEAATILMNRNKLTPASHTSWNLDGLSAYIKDYVLKYEKNAPPTIVDQARPLGKASPLKSSPQGYLKERQGGERETLHNYIRVMSRYLNEVNASEIKSNLMDEIARQYDPTKNSGVATRLGFNLQNGLPNVKLAQRMTGYGVFTFEGKPYVLPKELASRLGHYVIEPNNITKVINRITASSKGIILRSVWGAYSLGNLIGDTKQLFDTTGLEGKTTRTPTATATRSWAFLNPKNIFKGGKNFLTAAEATTLLMREADPATLNPRQKGLLNVAKQAQKIGIGTGAATGEMGARLKYDPQLRYLEYDPSGSLTSRALHKAGDVAHGLVNIMDVSREWMENVPRLAKYIEELGKGNTPEVAGKVTRSLMFDYTDLSPQAQHYLRGMMLPFFTYYYKNLVTRIPIPGLSADYTGSYKNAAVTSGKLLTRSLILGVALTAYNELTAPEAEHNLPDWKRYVPHVLIPWNDGEVLWIGFPGPANTAARMLGMAGAPQRILDLLRGRTTLGEEAGKGGKMVSSTLKGLVNPWYTTYHALTTGEDYRTGRNLSPEAADTKQKVMDRANYVVTQAFPPTGALYRGAREAPYDAELSPLSAKKNASQAFEFLKGFVFGHFAEPIDVEEEKIARMYEAFGRATNAQRTAALNAKNELAGILEESMLKKGPDATMLDVGLLAQAKGNEGQQLRSIAIQALRNISRNHKDYTPALKQLQVLSQRVGAKTLPYVAEELGRKGLLPGTETQQKSAFSKEAWANFGKSPKK